MPGLTAVVLVWTATASADQVANGVQLNGVQLNGVQLNGVQLNGVQLGGVTLQNARLDGSQIVADNENGTSNVHGNDLIGAELIGTSQDGDPLTLRIVNVDHGSPPNQDVWYYVVDVVNANGGTAALCVDESQNQVAAIPLAGRWSLDQGVAGGGSHIDDPSSFTFACQGAALGKCVELGYKPWDVVKGQSLAPFHQTCTRVIRADFCGDGTPHTQNGQLINVFDSLSVQTDTRNWPKEASWTPDGALGFNPLNRSHLDLVFNLSALITCGVQPRPTLLGNLVWSDSSEYQMGALLIDETPALQFTGL